MESIIKYKELLDEAWKFHPKDSPLRYIHFGPDVDGIELIKSIRVSSLGDILLPDGADLSIPDNSPDPYYLPIKTPAKDDLVTSVTLTVDRFEFDTTDFPESSKWVGDFAISFWYGDSKSSQVKQQLESWFSEKNQPRYTRDVWASDYAETGYEGHNQKSRAFRDGEADQFLSIVRDLFNNATGK